LKRLSKKIRYSPKSSRVYGKNEVGYFSKKAGSSKFPRP